MARKNYLISGHTSTGGLEQIDRRVLEDSNERKVLLLNLASDDSIVRHGKADFLTEYFRDLGAQRVSSLYPETPPEEIEEEFNEADVLYLPGGDTEVLLRNIDQKGLIQRILCFKGLISGNSAGAYAQCPEYLRMKEQELEKKLPGLGLVPFCLKVHYKPSMDPILRDLSKERFIYALGNNSAVIYDGNIQFIGNVWRFADGNKEPVSLK